MSTPYSAIEPYVQGNIEAELSTVNILHDKVLEAEYIGPRTAPPTQTETFFSHLPEYDPEKLKWAIITLWEGSPWQEKIFEAPTAIYWLQITGHISAEQRVTSPDNFLRLWVQREREKAAGVAPVAFCEPFQQGGNANG